MSKILNFILIMLVFQHCASSIPMAPSPEARIVDGVHSIFDGYVNATVSNTTVGAHRTLMEALRAAPAFSTKPYIIHVEAGVYNELVTVWKNRTNIWLVGDGAEVTKITMNRTSPAFETRDTPTFSVFGDGFVAKFISFENSAGPGAQAVAFLMENSRSAFYKCNFLGHQDTLYVKRGPQFFRDCNIYGTVDFIFGDAKVVFQSCNIYARKSDPIYFTAEGKMFPNDETAFVFHSSSFTVAPGVELSQRPQLFTAYLGRPWFDYSTVVVMECYLDGIMNPAGWAEWPDKPTDRLTYIEYNNWGPGANTSNRVKWEGYWALKLNQASDVDKYTVEKFILGETWLPATGVPCTLGFVNS